MSNSPKILAFTGEMGSGKSQSIKSLILNLPNFNVVNIKFAQPLYDIQSYIYERIGKELKSPKDRYLLQFLGTEWGRNTISKDIWTDIWERDVRHLNMFSKENNTLVTCDDCRFDNEALLIKKLGGKIIKIQSKKNSDRIVIEGSSHISEKGISDLYVDYIIDNDGTIEELNNKIKNLLHKEKLCLI